MRRFHPIPLPAAVIAFSFAFTSAAFASGFQIATDVVRVQFAHGDTVLGTVSTGAPVFQNRDAEFSDFPTEITGWNYTYRNADDPANVTLDVPAGTTLYLMAGTAAQARGTRLSAEANGWSKAPAAHTNADGETGTLLVYKKTFHDSAHVTLVGAGGAGAIIFAQNLELLTPPSNSPPADQPQPAQVTPDQTSQVATHLDPSANVPLVSIIRAQVSILTLSVLQLPSGEQLGQASRLILTATRGHPREGDPIPVSFTIPVGSDMQLVLDDVARAIDVRYRIGGVKKLELSFEDKYTPKDRGSIGAPIATLMLSLIRNFEIDPDLAMTGDVAADARVEKVGGIAAKLRGAIKSKCKLVALPNENFLQVQDALLYDGPDDVSNVQVFGISNLDDAAAIARLDRSAKLAQAIDLFAAIQNSLAQSSDYLYSAEAQEKLHDVLELAPNHLSAKLLLAYSRHELPRLSALATQYYISLAVSEFWNAPAMASHVTDFSADDALEKLNKLRPLGDLTVRPYLDSWIDYIQLYSRARSGEPITTGQMNGQYQQVLNQAAKLNTNRDLSEKMLQEGI